MDKQPLSYNSIRHKEHMSAIIIDMDEIKKKISGYSDSKAKNFHERSSTLSKQTFTTILNSCDYDNVILLGGGSASGKTEYISSEIVDQKAIVFDGTLSKSESLNKKLKEIKKTGKKVSIIVVIPENIAATFNTFLMRTRKIPEEVFYSTHSGCRKTLLWLNKEYPNISIKIIINKGDSTRMEQITFNVRSDLKKYIEQIQLSKKEIQIKIGADL